MDEDETQDISSHTEMMKPQENLQNPPSRLGAKNKNFRQVNSRCALFFTVVLWRRRMDIQDITPQRRWKGNIEDIQTSVVEVVVVCGGGVVENGRERAKMTVGLFGEKAL
ncbi:unnamed protein product, partial [Cuscuta europaea]